MPTGLGTERYERELPACTAALAELVGTADPGTPVPTCPGWTLADLAGHVGGTHRWATAIVTRRATERVRFRDVPERRPPVDPADLPDWLRAGAADVVGAVRDAGPGTPVWTWTDQRSAGFWLRRMTYEGVVHGVDATLAVGAPVELAPDLAADGVSEWLEITPFFLAGSGDPARALADGRSLHLHATDGGLGEAGEWVVRGTAGGPRWEHGHAKADVAVRGPASTLLQVLSQRLPADAPGVEVLGDRSVLDGWLAATEF